MEDFEILKSVTTRALEYLRSVPQRNVFPSQESLEKLDQLSVSLPNEGESPESILEKLDSIGSANTVVSNGGRYFGFVFGGSVPASLAASWMVSTWDQNAVFKVSSPIAAHIEKVTANWLLDFLRLPSGSAVGFVTGTTMANFLWSSDSTLSFVQEKGLGYQGQRNDRCSTHSGGGR